MLSCFHYQQGPKHRRSLPNNFNLSGSCPPSTGPPTPSNSGKTTSKITTSTPKPAKSVQEILKLYKPQSRGKDPSLLEETEEPTNTTDCIAQRVNKYTQPLAGNAKEDVKRPSDNKDMCENILPAPVVPVSEGIKAKLRLTKQLSSQEKGTAGPMRAFPSLPREGGVDRPQPAASTPDNGEKISSIVSKRVCRNLLVPVS